MELPPRTENVHSFAMALMASLTGMARGAGGSNKKSVTGVEISGDQLWQNINQEDEKIKTVNIDKKKDHSQKQVKKRNYLSMIFTKVRF